MSSANTSDGNTKGDASDVTQVLNEEFLEIHGVAIESDYNSSVDNLPEGQSALCLSGGGIRSAAFALGVLQGLARLGVLDKFHYLSTVSGGGYVGSWLTAWRHRQAPYKVTARLKMSHAETKISANAAPDPLDSLRGGASYLTPRVGVLSPDTWTACVLFFRNITLTNLLVMPLILGILMVAKAFLSYVQGSTAANSTSFLFFFRVTVVLTIIGWVMLATGRPSWVRRITGENLEKTYLRRLKFGMSAIVIASISFALANADIPNAEDGTVSWLFQLPPMYRLHAVCGLTGALVGIASVAIAGAITAMFFANEGNPDQGATLGLKRRPWLGLCVAGLLAGALGGEIISFGINILETLNNTSRARIGLTVALSPGLFLFAFTVAENLYLGLTTRKPSLPENEAWNDQWGDEEREWVARTDGYLVYIGVLLSVLMTVSFFGYDVLCAINADSWKKLITFVGVLSSALGSVGLGASSLSSPKGEAASTKKLPVKTILNIATPIFLLCGLVVLSGLIDELLFGKTVVMASDHSSVVEILLLLSLIFILISIGAAYFININRYSLHDLYRMRLTREFLGASHSNRKGDPWTGFDTSDDLPFPMPNKDPISGKRYLYHIVNATLNNLKQTPLQWGYRKGESFIFSPIFTGSENVMFRRTIDYGGGVRLGVAMAVSGAAVSPNAGYSTIKGVALLLTLFNLRLGVWAGNPNRAHWKSRGPDFALSPLWDEALMNTTDQSDYVYLSDGGHFDNLGLFEMLRRRCKFIVVSDATEDGDFKFEDLGNAVRRAKATLNKSTNFTG